jgi:hypothetical protein
MYYLDFGRLKSAIDKSKEELNYNKQNTLFNKNQLAAQDGQYRITISYT